MTQFLFRLQRLLELRSQQEQKLAESLARALDRVEEAREAQRSLDDVRNASTQQLAAAHGRAATAGQLQNMGFLMEQLDEYLNIAAGAEQEAVANASSAREELVTAHQARRTLDRLRERQYTDHTTAAIKQDQQQMDAFAMTRFALANSPLATDR